MAGLALWIGCAAAEPSFQLRAEAGLQHETSEFPVLKIGDSPAIVVAGPRETHTDVYRHFMLSASASAPVGGGFGALANFNVDSRTGAHSVEFDTEISHADVGAQFTQGAVTVMARAVREYWKVSGEPYRQVYGGALDFVTALSPRHALLVSAEASRYEHPGDNSFQDADRRALTGTLRLGDITPLRGNVSLQATLAAERNRAGDPSLDLNSVFFRLAWEGEPAQRWKLQAAVNGQRARFADVDPVLGVRRDDRYLSFDASLARRVSEHLSFVLDAALSAYRSNAEALYNNWSAIGAGLQLEF